jgi:hypothetical protein
MITMTFEQPELEPVPLVPEQTMGGVDRYAGPDEYETDVRASIGKPLDRSISEVDVVGDPELADFLSAHPAEKFHLVRLVCSFSDGEEDVLERATFGVRLENMTESSAPAHPPPIAWSLAPLRLITKLRHSGSAGGGVNLGPMLSLTGQWATEAEVSRCYVYALGEGEEDPEWRYVRTATVYLDGVHPMTMVIQRSLAPIKATISLHAIVRKKRFGLFRYSADLGAKQRTLMVG